MRNKAAGEQGKGVPRSGFSPDRRSQIQSRAEAEDAAVEDNEERLREMEAQGLAARVGGRGELRLTQKGVASLETLSQVPGPSREVPHFHDDQRTLDWLGERILVFERRAPNQMAVLLAFERQREPWPSCIDNPFGKDADASIKLEQTLKDLNRKLRKHGIRFHVTMKGCVCWMNENE